MVAQGYEASHQRSSFHLPAVPTNRQNPTHGSYTEKTKSQFVYRRIDLSNGPLRQLRSRC